MKKITKGLRIWFEIHFIIDMSLAIPLMFWPNDFLSFLGWQSVEVVTVRLVAAALFAIGGVSAFAYKLDKSAFRIMLLLKLLWSSAAIVALSLSLLDEFSYFLFAILLVFVGFFKVWFYYYSK